MKWHRRFIEMAELVSTWSKDPSTHVGCVLVNPATRTVIATGYNGIPRDVVDTPRRMLERPVKYEWMEHAERNAVYDAARRGVSTAGCVAYLNWRPEGVCSGCARALLQAGVTRVIGPDKPFAGKGAGEHYDLSGVAGRMFAEAGIEVVVV